MPTDEILAQLLESFSHTATIELAIFDRQLRFLAVNQATVASTGIPAEAYVGNRLRDFIGDAASQPDALMERVFATGDAPAPLEIAALLPTRTEIGYWILKVFPVKGRSGTVGQVATLSVEVTTHRKLEQRFRNLGGESLGANNREYRQLSRELHDSIQAYDAAVAASLERLSLCAAEPEKVPELLTQSLESVDERMRNLATVVARCCGNFAGTQTPLI